MTALFSFGKKKKKKEEKKDTSSQAQAASKKEQPKKDKKPKKELKKKDAGIKPKKASGLKKATKKSAPVQPKQKKITAKKTEGTHKILLAPLVSEKSTLLQGANQYVFRVAASADKISIRRAVQNAYGVEVGKVRTQIIKPQKRRFRFTEGQTRSWKKAIVTVAAGDKIDIFSGV